MSFSKPLNAPYFYLFFIFIIHSATCGNFEFYHMISKISKWGHLRWGKNFQNIFIRKYKYMPLLNEGRPFGGIQVGARIFKMGGIGKLRYIAALFVV